MKNNLRIISVLILSMTFMSCNSSSSDTKMEAHQMSDDIHIYYFHNTKRCATCNAVEAETKAVLQKYYGEKLENGEMVFTSLNIEEEEGKKMAGALGIAGQTLLLVKGETKINLTSQAFMNARKNPTKFHEIVKSELDKLN